MQDRSDKVALDYISHLILTAPTREIYHASVSWFERLGLKAIMTESSAGTTATWLQLFSSSEAMNDVSIKLVYSPSGLRKQAHSSKMDWRSVPAIATIITNTLQELEVLLSSMPWAYQRYTVPSKNASESNEYSAIYTHDPMNNLLIFTDKPNPFGSKHKPKHMHEESESAAQEQPKEALETTSGKRRKIAILTSGGDAPGMNAAVRGVVRTAIMRGCDAYAVHEGYQGLVDGGDMIKKMGWDDVQGYLTTGGTVIGTARCKAFRERWGRLKAAKNLVKNGIDALVVCGGDGSLTGADLFRGEWPDLLEELVQTNELTKDEAATFSHLNIVGLVGSIDNDMSSTDITIGAVTCLHRICESIDSISSTASSHSRAFVVEVMGRHCGWLALMAGIATGADFIFIPERPPSGDNWQDEMCADIKKHRDLGKRKTIVIVCEGAIDSNLQPITAKDLKDLLTDRLHLDTRMTILGHVQRGGKPCAFDRNLATIQGIEAVEAVLASKPDVPSPMIAMCENRTKRIDLMKAVALTGEVAKAIGRKDFVAAMQLRDPAFNEQYEQYVATTQAHSTNAEKKNGHSLRIGIINVGAPAGGMNAAVRTAVRYALNRGHVPFAINNGFPGLIAGQVREMKWMDVDGWMSHGGSELGTNRDQPSLDLGMVSYQLQKFNIQGLLLIGGFEAYTACLEMYNSRDSYPAFCMPMVHIPATISNNVPGTEYSLGCDTSLNAIMESCDALKQSATASRKRVFVVEVHGGKTGFLAVMSGLAVGATSVYIPEEGINLTRLQKDVRHLCQRYAEDAEGRSQGRVIIRSESASKTYTTDIVSAIIKEEGHQQFDSRTAILGHIQQGNSPSPLDRVRAMRLSVCAIDFIEEHVSGLSSSSSISSSSSSAGPEVYNKDPESIAVAGIHGNKVNFTSVEALQRHTDMKNRKPMQSWWMDCKDMCNLLARRTDLL
ncbi:6-phosphofructokinase [Lobosporangium transversale]|uniref:ATP-dependent 6-phosphofructokinase n=1 Tax=Lobosporangium transversale TaxID=64571 RepID=A0A1Y2GZB0_9FUNG|nr:6-phosphofructokinase [Lobosporangium transversale]ORZ27134.1 6-phosphofructokinase [Lobosporangium transversale]|eukprot:XP_021884881.1 6-phosphofructokinase [Lobosporangium transversale]